MGRWTDLAQWIGTDNHGGAMTAHRGVVLHIAEGYYQGTIGWQRNPESEVSSHFIVGRSGQVAQMVDTSLKAWTQREGNAEWLSIEFEGFTPSHELYRPGWEKLSAYQVEAAARILARAHQLYAVPFTLAEGPTSHGLGYHSMGGTAWGHLRCPGAPIIGQRADILARARSIAGVPDPTPPGQPAPGPIDWTGRLIMALPTLTLGARGTDVKREQALLNVAGARLVEDGNHGPATDSAVRAFQRTNGLSVDGATGPKTWAKLLGE